MTDRNVIHTIECATAEELSKALAEMMDICRRHPSTVYMDLIAKESVGSDTVTLLLVEKTLSDGSTVFNIEVC
jgi:hypothetical protein